MEIEHPPSSTSTPTRPISIKFNIKGKGRKKSPSLTPSDFESGPRVIDGDEIEIEDDDSEIDHKVSNSTEMPVDPAAQPTEVEPPTKGRPRRAAAVQAKRKLKADEDADDADDEYRSSRPAIRKSGRVTRSSAR